MSKKELDRMRTEVELALKLCDSETADGIIGSPPPEEYGVLVKGVKAVYHMLWVMAKANGLKQNQTTFRMGAQAMLMLATIVHYAYALGVKRGREAPSPPTSETAEPFLKQQREAPSPQPSPPEGEGGG